MRQIVEAIYYLHNLQIIHRDLKLDNILVNFENEENKKNMNMLGAQVKIIDIGFATKLNKSNSLACSVLGSPINMDPEILKKLNHMDDSNKGYDEKVDIWSLGTLCYEMLIGKPTFEANNMRELVQKIETGDYTLPSSLSREVVSFLNAMLQYDASIRLDAKDLKRHYFLTKNIKDFTQINLNEIKNDNISGDQIRINVKTTKNVSIWASFRNENFLDDVPSFLAEEPNNKALEIIPEMANLEIKENGTPSGNYNPPGSNINNNSNSSYKQNNSTNEKKYNRVPSFGANKNNVNPTGFHNKLLQKNQQMGNSQRKDITNNLLKVFDKMNQEFLYLPPTLIPISPNDDPRDLDLEEENFFSY